MTHIKTDKPIHRSPVFGYGASSFCLTRTHDKAPFCAIIIKSISGSETLRSVAAAVLNKKKKKKKESSVEVERRRKEGNILQISSTPHKGCPCMNTNILVSARRCVRLMKSLVWRYPNINVDNLSFDSRAV